MAKMQPECQDQDECPHAHRSAEIAVRKVFAILGVDVDKPESVEEFREDLRFGKRMRRASDKGFFAVAIMIATGIGALVVAGVQASLGRH